MRNLIELVKTYKSGLETLLEWTNGGGIVVAQDQAQSRSDICTGRLSCSPCPNNTQGGMVETFISDAIKRHTELRNSLNLRVLGDRKLLTCSGCGCPLKTKVFLRLQDLGVDESEFHKFNPKCWMIAEHKQQKEQNEK